MAFVGKLCEATVCDDDAVEVSRFDDQLQVVAKGARWKLILNEVPDTDAAAEEYASNGDLDERFRQEVALLRFFTIRFDDMDMARRVLRAIAQTAVTRGETAWIDTDYGWVIHASDLLRKVDENSRWDWRHAPEEG
jgi:hypothetical protein